QIRGAPGDLRRRDGRGVVPGRAGRRRGRVLHDVLPVVVRVRGDDGVFAGHVRAHRDAARQAGARDVDEEVACGVGAGRAGGLRGARLRGHRERAVARGGVPGLVHLLLAIPDGHRAGDPVVLPRHPQERLPRRFSAGPRLPGGLRLPRAQRGADEGHRDDPARRDGDDVQPGVIRMRAFARYSLLVLLLLPSAARANIGPRWWGNLVSEPEGLKAVAITREQLTIDLRPLAKRGLVEVEAIYYLQHSGSLKKLDLLFVSGAPGV